MPESHRHQTVCPTYPQDDPASSSGQLSEEDSCSADDEPKDPAEDSDSESGGSSDNHGDWAPLYRPHLSSHGNQAQLSDTERAGPQDRGDKAREEGGDVERNLIYVLLLFLMNVNYSLNDSNYVYVKVEILPHCKYTPLQAKVLKKNNILTEIDRSKIDQKKG